MMIFNVIGLIATVYYAALFIGVHLLGFSKEDIIEGFRRKIMEDLNLGTKKYSLATDFTLLDSAKKVIMAVGGESSYEKWNRLSKCLHQTPMINVDERGVLPFVDIALQPDNASQSTQYEIMFVNEIFSRLRMHNLPVAAATEWTTHAELFCPCLRVYYSRNAEELEILRCRIDEKKNMLLASKKEIVDEELQ